MEDARVVVVHGISRQPYNPLFHYRLAQTFGPTGEDDEAIKYIRLAYMSRLNLDKGATLPDPLTDPAFDNIHDRERFINIVESAK